MKKILKRCLLTLIFSMLLISNAFALKNASTDINSSLIIESQSAKEDYYLYYKLLSTNQKKVYNELLNAAKSNKVTVFPSVSINIDELKDLFESLLNDHPELFYLEPQIDYFKLSNNNILYIKLNYNEYVNKENLFNEQIEQIVHEASKLPTNLEKEKYIHDYITKNVSYNMDAKANQSAYSTIVNKETVCAGYSRAFQLLMQKLNIPTYYIQGTTEDGNHAWNIVYINGNYYNVDLTFDDSTSSYDFYNLNNQQISRTHSRIGVSSKLNI